MIKGLGKRKISAVLILSFLFTVMQTAGWQISMKYGTTVHTSVLAQKIGMLSGFRLLLAGLMEFVIWSIALYWAFRFLDRVKPSAGSAAVSFRGWAALAVLLFLCWLPVLLGCYPGFYNYDIAGQLPQVMYREVPYSTHHPLLHTLLAGGILTLGYHIGGDNLTAGVFLHSIVQMLFCASFFAYFVQWIWKTAKSRWLTAAAFAYYALFPTIVLFTMSTTKDVACSVLLQTGAIFLYEAYRDRETFWSSRRKVCLAFAALVLSCLFRNNVVYAVAAMFLCLLPRMRKNKRMLLLLAGAAVSCLACQSGLKLLVGAQEGSMAEACSVPFQQVARVYAQEGEAAFSAEELELLYAAASRETLTMYNPLSADNIKTFTHFKVVSENKWEYILLWLKKGLEYPGIYLMSFMDNTYQAWYPGTSIICDPAQKAFYYFECKGLDPVPLQPKIQKIYEFCQEISSGCLYQKYPVVRLFFSIGGMFWAALFTFFYGIWAGRAELAAAQLFILLVCLTVFLGPVSLVRYYLVLFYALPVSAAFLADNRRTS